MSKTSKNIGNKAKNLGILQDAGFCVPDFRVIPHEDLESIFGSKVDAQEYLDLLLKDLHATLFAVRSSLTCEDGENQSYAGQFHTELRVHSEDLVDAIQKTVALSRKNLKEGEINIILQEYIEAQYAGVCFTRNPSFGREMVIEYHAGIGESLVSGKITPISKKGYWNEKISSLPFGCDVSVFQSIEKLFGFPQDIEWCISKGKFYILQSRHITTIKPSEYREIQELEKLLGGMSSFHLEKSEVTEVAPRPTPFTFSLLSKIYSQGGPIYRVYAKYGIHYEDTRFLTVIGNELFVDKIQESKSLLFSLGSFDRHFFYKLFLSFLNIFRLTFLSFRKVSIESFSISLQEKIEASHTFRDFQESLDHFLGDYECIFEVNLFTSFAYKKLENILASDAQNMSKILSLGVILGKNMNYKIQIPSSSRGNSLEILDTSETRTYQTDKVSDDILKWWENLSSIRKKMLTYPIIEAYTWGKLREYGRILMIKNLSAIREQLRVSELENIAFLTIDEIKNDMKTHSSISERIDLYRYYSSFTFPSVLRSIYKENISKKVIQGISPGVFHGVLTDESSLVPGKGKQILFTQTLSPHLAQYFDCIGGIISTHGGMLSHLAILAREKGIPVIIIDEKRVRNLKLGEDYEIDGDIGQYSLLGGKIS